MTRTRSIPAPPPAVVELAGGIGPDLAAYTQTKIAHVLAHTGRPVLHTRVRVLRHHDPARQRPVTAQVNVDLDGRLLRVQVAATKPREAVDRLVDRLRLRLAHVALDWEARRGRTYAGVPHEWRHGYPPHARAADRRPSRERKVIRHKTVFPRRCSLDEAVAEMDDLDFDFHLFVEAGRGVDSVVYRAGPTGLRLAQVDGRTDLVVPGLLPVTASRQPAPLLSVAEAVERLALMGLPFVFYLDAEHWRGCVLYLRHDGHYGLIDLRPEAGWS